MMQWQFRHPAKKLVVVTAFLAMAASYLTLVTIQCLAAHFATVPDIVNLRRAIWLDPGNAEYRYRLGRYQLLSQQSPQAALPWLESATELNPYHGHYWLDLAIAQQSLGDPDSEKQALQRALTADPRTPSLAWQAANLYLAQGSLELALSEFRVVMENDPYAAALAVRTCWKIRPDIDYMLANVIPAKADETLLDFLVSKNETAAAAKVWERSFSLQQPVDRSHLFGYMN